MVAVYPAAIKNFAYRQDFTDLVEAADVNVTYDETRAIQTTLGVNPQQETIDSTLTKYSTVSSRISAVRRGTTVPYVGASAHNVGVAFNTDLIPTWNAKLFDTHHMISGTNLTCPRDGIYHFNFYIRWHRDNINNANLLPRFDRSGKLQIEAVQTGSSNFLTCQTDWFPEGFQDFARQSASMIYPWYKGNAVRVKAYQSCYQAGTLTATIYANIAYIRDIPS